jgi:cyclopropane-fatty-acyl-phospholipid synthase
MCKGLPVVIRLQDYRDLNERFDHIVSIGMFEHVGSQNYQRFMQVVTRCLADQGSFFLQTIGINETAYKMEPWLNKYIFPNFHLPSLVQLSQTMEPHFIMEDWHNLGPHYDLTLMAWYRNFTSHWNQLKDRYDDRFYRMWTYYLLSCAGAFRARETQVWQILLSRKK